MAEEKILEHITRLGQIMVDEVVEELRALLVEKISVFIEDLGYDPENICILVPRNREITVIQESLKEQGFGFPRRFSLPSVSTQAQALQRGKNGKAV